MIPERFSDYHQRFLAAFEGQIVYYGWNDKDRKLRRTALCRRKRLDTHASLASITPVKEAPFSGFRTIRESWILRQCPWQTIRGEDYCYYQVYQARPMGGKAFTVEEGIWRLDQKRDQAEVIFIFLPLPKIPFIRSYHSLGNRRFEV